uniref:Uncharacterized protein n=1 Tax=Arabidopsis thaliana TaxID=3702 RepID=Q8GY32_ARATH|nr:unknown protein [Arabidopsis thaliana]
MFVIIAQRYLVLRATCSLDMQTRTYVVVEIVSFRQMWIGLLRPKLLLLLKIRIQLRYNSNQGLMKTSWRPNYRNLRNG